MVPQLLALIDCFHLRLGQGAACYEAHVASVAGEALDVPGSQGQRTGVEETGQAVVAPGGLERGYI